MDKTKPPEIGNKRRAGNLLSSYLRLIAQETIVITDLDKGEDKVVCKAEALSKLIWDRALGRKEVLEDGTTVQHDPDKDMIKLVYDRMEGKVANPEENKQRTQELPDKVSDINKDRLNKIATDGSKKKV